MTDETKQAIAWLNSGFDSVSIKTVIPIMEEFLNYYHLYSNQNPPSWQLQLIINELHTDLQKDVIEAMRQIVAVADFGDDASRKERLANDLYGIGFTNAVLRYVLERMPDMQEQMAALKGDELRKTQLAFCLDSMNGEQMMAWCAALAGGSQDAPDDPVHPWQHVIEMPRFDKAQWPNAVLLCQCLISGESKRLQYWNGKAAIITAKEFNRDTRNGCFDIYIDSRYEALRTELAADNCRLYDPTKQDVYAEMLRREKAAAEDFSIPRPASITPASEMRTKRLEDATLELFDLFLRYLADKVEQAGLDESMKGIDRTGLPGENRYTDLVRWIARQKSEGKDWYKEAGFNRTRMCEILSNVLGWVVDQNSLRKAENRLKN